MTTELTNTQPASSGFFNACTNDAISDLERHVLAAAQVDLHAEHSLSGGVYARTITIPAGTVLTGATHKKDHINIACGDITVTTDTGLVRLTGYHVIETKAGSKRAGFAHAETKWTTVCYTKLTDIEAIEDELVEESGRLQSRKASLQNHNHASLEE